MRSLQNTYDWLAQAEAPRKSDAIFVLAGRECRKVFALRMFAEGWAHTLLLSVARFEIRSFSRLNVPLEQDLLTLAAAVKPVQRHYFVTLQAGTAEAQRIAVRRFGTWGEILAFSQWLQEHQPVRSAMVVSSAFHLKRVRWCCRRLVPSGTQLRFVAVPEEGPNFDRDHWWRDALPRKLVLQELAKLMLYAFLQPSYRDEHRASSG